MEMRRRLSCRGKAGNRPPTPKTATPASTRYLRNVTVRLGFHGSAVQLRISSDRFSLTHL